MIFLGSATGNSSQLATALGHTLGQVPSASTRIFRYATVEAIYGMAQRMRNHDFDTPPNIISDRRKRKHDLPAHSGGFFYTGLTVEMQESLVESAAQR